MNTTFKKARILLVGLIFGASLAVPVMATAHKIPTDQKSIDEGKKLYLKNRASCHGVKGHGDGPASDVLDPKPRNYTEGKFLYGSTDDALFKTAWEGSPNKASGMKGFKGRLKEEQVLEILGYIRATFIPKGK